VPTARRIGAAVIAGALGVPGLGLGFGFGFGFGFGSTSTGTANAATTTPLELTVRDAPPAKRPFRDLTATRITVGGSPLDVVIADEPDERSLGLRRRRRGAAPYDGMLFAFDGPTTTNFTMSTVPVALDIGFYSADGRVVDRLRMEPCAGAEVECPVYRASGPFVYALETAVGALPRGRMRAADSA
jgi:uncharacterized membrane protein (UPF0127 family)